jgi:hypothetical protein
MKPFAYSAILAGALFCAPACSDSHSHDGVDGGAHTSAFASCQAILDACHEVDTGEGPIHDCHDVAHDATSEETCAPKKAACLATCAAAAADAGPSDSGLLDTSAKDAESDAAHNHDHDH